MDDTDLSLRLSAYRDGELSGDELRALERLLTEDATARAEFEALLETDNAIGRAFDAMLDDPVPVALLRSLDPSLPVELEQLVEHGARGRLRGRAKRWRPPRRACTSTRLHSRMAKGFVESSQTVSS
ncbi:MAG: hypothetical protein HC844_21130, partial [Tabrizicola sp.]|nr:hypothetical protein [Tabrizicola sp.]